jgi:hypothetical protein
MHIHHLAAVTAPTAVRSFSGKGVTVTADGLSLYLSWDEARSLAAEMTIIVTEEGVTQP